MSGAIVVVSAQLIASIVLLIGCGGTPGWSILAHNFSSGDDIIIRVRTDGVSIDRLVEHRHPIAVVYAGEVRPSSISIALVDPETCAVLDRVDQLPMDHATVVVDMRMELIVGSEDPNGLDNDPVAPTTDMCADVIES